MLVRNSLGGFGCSSCVSELEEVKAAEMPLSLPCAGLLCFPLNQKSGWGDAQWSQGDACGCALEGRLQGL